MPPVRHVTRLADDPLLRITASPPLHHRVLQGFSVGSWLRELMTSGAKPRILEEGRSCHTTVRRSDWRWIERAVTAWGAVAPPAPHMAGRADEPLPLQIPHEEGITDQTSTRIGNLRRLFGERCMAGQARADGRVVGLLPVDQLGRECSSANPRTERDGRCRSRSGGGMLRGGQTNRVAHPVAGWGGPNSCSQTRPACGTCARPFGRRVGSPSMRASRKQPTPRPSHGKARRGSAGPRSVRQPT
jgi:hypothetical protein